MNTLVLGKTYRLYGKMGNMPTMLPVCGGDFVTNLLKADLFHVATDDKLAACERELKFLSSQGTFEFRVIKGELTI